MRETDYASHDHESKHVSRPSIPRNKFVAMEFHKAACRLQGRPQQRVHPTYIKVGLISEKTKEHVRNVPDHRGDQSEGVAGCQQKVLEGKYSYQQNALDTFRENLTNAGLLSPSSHDEATLIRFLRARGFDPAAAQQQFAATEQWRKQHDVDNLYASFTADELQTSRRFYPRWTGHRDKHGVPLYVYHLASLKPLQKELDAVPPDRRFKRMVALYEYMAKFTLPLCSSLPHSSNSPVATTSIIDLKDMSLGALWSFRSHLQDSSRLATANYPETLHAIAVVNSPSFFPTVWGWIKGWFDEGTRNKIHVLGSDPGPTLLQFIHPADLPKQYGGNLEWSFQDEPDLDDDVRKVLIHGFPHGPVVFRDQKVLPATEALDL